LTETVGNLVHSYTYGLNGALLNESKPGSSLAYVYDGLGRLTQESHDGYEVNLTSKNNRNCSFSKLQLRLFLQGISFLSR